MGGGTGAENVNRVGSHDVGAAVAEINRILLTLHLNGCES